MEVVEEWKLARLVIIAWHEKKMTPLRNKERLTSSGSRTLCSSWAWALFSAVWSAITFCLSTVSRHWLQLQYRYLQYRLCPFKRFFSPWFWHLAQFGGVRGFTVEFEDEAFESALLDSISALLSISVRTCHVHSLRNAALGVCLRAVQGRATTIVHLVITTLSF